MYSELEQVIERAQELIDEYEECIENLKEILASMDA